MKKLLILIVILGAGLFLFEEYYSHPLSGRANRPKTDSVLQQAFERRLSNIQAEGEGRVIKILPDDSDGRRHQKFVIRLASGQTILIAHNIDIAPRVPSLKPGDLISFCGEYEWNAEGGVVHWTHHDPSGSHPSGWIKRSGEVFR